MLLFFFMVMYFVILLLWGEGVLFFFGVSMCVSVCVLLFLFFFFGLHVRFVVGFSCSVLEYVLFLFFVLWCCGFTSNRN